MNFISSAGANKIKKIRKNGMAMIVVLLILVLLFVLGLAIIYYTNADLISAVGEKNSASALYLAQAGLIFASVEYNTMNLAHPGDTYDDTKTMETGQFTIKAVFNEDNTVTLTSTGKAANIKRTIYAALSNGSIISWYSGDVQ